LPPGGLYSVIEKDPKIPPSLLQSFFTIAFFAFLISIKHLITPDFFHFVICNALSLLLGLFEEDGHNIWILLIFSIYKRFDYSTPQLAVISYAELLLAYLIRLDLGPFGFLILTGVFMGLVARSRYPVNIPFWLFLIFYFSGNFVINCIDLWLYHYGSYYHDEQFLKSFSFKIFQTFLTLLFSVVMAQMLSPAHDCFMIQPSLLTYM